MRWSRRTAAMPTRRGLLGVHPNYLHRLIRNLELKESLKDALREIPPRS